MQNIDHQLFAPKILIASSCRASSSDTVDRSVLMQLKSFGGQKTAWPTETPNF
jgi:hypothetical protein